MGPSEPIDGKWKRDPEDPNGWIHIATGIKFEEGQGGKWRNKSTGEVVEEFTEPKETEDKDLIDVDAGVETGLGGGEKTSTDVTDPSKKDSDIDPTDSDTAERPEDPFVKGPADPVPTDGATDTTDTITGGAGTDEDLGTGTTFEDSDQTGAGTGETGTGTTGPTDETGGGDADTIGDGTGAADTIGTGTGVSDTPGAGAGDVGDPGDVGEGTGHRCWYRHRHRRRHRVWHRDRHGVRRRAGARHWQR